jgi:hypothetical protein
MSKKFLIEDGGVFNEVHTDGTKIHRRIVDPGRIDVLKRNQEIRKSKGAIRKMDWGRLELDIPFGDWKVLCSMYPALGDSGHPDHKSALRTFMASSVSDPYRLHDRSKVRG